MAHGVEVWQRLPMLRRATIRAARFVTAPSTDTIQKLIDVQHIARERTCLLPWPLSPDFLRFTERVDLPVPASFPEGRVVLTIGRAAASEKYKGTDDLIRAIGQLYAAVPGLQLVSVGGGDDLPRLQSIAREEGVADRVHFLQRLSREQLAACYARAEIFAMPSAGEGFGLVFLEAMAFGKPVVAASAGGALDLVEDGANGLLVPPHEPVALAAALQRLLKDGALRSALGARGAAIARGKYQFGSLCANLEQLFEECAMHSEN
jgi:glycosyltransferase involved in cell wall biosynthesis